MMTRSVAVSYTHLDVYKRQDQLLGLAHQPVEIGRAVRLARGHQRGDHAGENLGLHLALLLAVVLAETPPWRCAPPEPCIELCILFVDKNSTVALRGRCPASPLPVSYTHLDVYKRQFKGFGRVSFET